MTLNEMTEKILKPYSFSYGEEIRVTSPELQYLYERGYKTIFCGHNRLGKYTIRFVSKHAPYIEYELSTNIIEKIPNVIKALDKVLR